MRRTGLPEMRIDPKARSEDTALGTELSMQSEDGRIPDFPEQCVGKDGL